MIDELSLGLAPAVVEQLLEVVREINRRGVTVIVVEQSVNVALRVAQRAVFMEKGEVRFFGDTSELLRRPDILRAVYVRGTEGAPRATPSAGGAARAVRRAGELAHATDVLEVDQVSKRFGGILALATVSLTLRDGEVLGLIGPNGSGKTTLFDVISGYQAPDEGHVRMEGVDIGDMSPEQRASMKLIRRFQDARLFPSLTVHEALMVAFDQQHQARSAALALIQAPQSRRAERRVRQRADLIIEVLGLGAYRNKLVGELSTGLRRITDLACVLATEPRVLLLDEPSTGIASSEVEGLAPLLRRVRTETGCSILIIEHAMSLLSSVADRLIALDQGRVIAEGPPDDVLSDDRVVESYLGRTVQQKARR
jgi:branched-chain amino acid transport system ATP-binding protein